MERQDAETQYIKATEEHAASAQVLPDNRLLLTLDDGRSFVIDAERLSPGADGTYQVHLSAAIDSPTSLFRRTAASTSGAEPAPAAERSGATE
jgi:hypothetical protein